MRIAVLGASLFLGGTVFAAEKVTAEYLPSPGARSGFEIGAGIGLDDGQVYDNRVAQTFAAQQSGHLQEVKFVGGSAGTPTVPLRIDVTTLNEGQPGVILGTTYVPPAGCPTRIPFPYQLNRSAVFSSKPIALRAGASYALVFRTDVIHANYRLAGGAPRTAYGIANYSEGELMRSQNGARFRADGASGDLYFQVTVKERRLPVAPWFVVVGTALLVLIAQR